MAVTTGSIIAALAPTAIRLLIPAAERLFDKAGSGPLKLDWVKTALRNLLNLQAPEDNAKTTDDTLTGMIEGILGELKASGNLAPAVPVAPSAIGLMSTQAFRLGDTTVVLVKGV